MPLGWLASPEPPPPVEQPPNELQLDQRLRSGALAPEDVDWIPRGAAKSGVLKRRNSGALELALILSSSETLS